jgi:hypothetical protein
MVSNATFNNISVISWRSVLLVEKTGVPKEKTTTLSQVTNKLCHILLYILDLDWEGFEYLTLVVIGTDCIGSHKSNYHMITTTTAHKRRKVSMVCQHIFNWEFVSTWLYLQYSLVPDQSMLYYEFVSTIFSCSRSVNVILRVCIYLTVSTIFSCSRSVNVICTSLHYLTF